MTSHDPAPDERRIAHRSTVLPESRLSLQTNLLIPGQSRPHKCRITDSSATGYRVVLLSHHHDAASRQFAQGQEVMLAHADGWSRTVSTRWILGNQIGLKILNPVTRVILSDERGAPQPYECKLLGTHGELYRITMPEPPVMFGHFTLELPNGEHLRVRVRWTLDGEICLQQVVQRRRL